jgi:transposase
VSMTNPADRVEIITAVQRRRRWTASEKLRMVEETFEPGMTVSLVARRHGVAPNQLFTWRRLVAQGALTAAGSGEEVVPAFVPASDYRALQSQVRELQDCSARRRWKPRSSRRCSNTPRGQKNGCGCHRRRRRTVPDEDRGGGDWSLPLQSD